MTRLARALATAWIVLGASGCGWMLSSPEQYAAYRRTRVERTFDARIAAAHDYLQKYPSGAYAADVRRYYERAEPLYFASREKTSAGLEAYLKALPKGPHAPEVRSRLAAMSELKNRPDLLAIAAKSTEERLALAAKSRERAAGELGFWVENLADSDAYASPFGEGPGDLLVAFSLSLPKPNCRADGDGRTCTKDVTLPYWIPAGGAGGLLERELAFTVSIRQDASGKPTSSRIEGEELFSRLGETKTLKIVTATSIDARAEAVRHGVDLAVASFEARTSGDASCRKEVVPPEVLRLECKGMRLVAKAASQSGGIDVIELGP